MDVWKQSSADIFSSQMMKPKDFGHQLDIYATKHHEVDKIVLSKFVRNMYRLLTI